MSLKKPASGYKPGLTGKKVAAASRIPVPASSTATATAAAARKKSLAAQIAELSNPTPKDFDPEDDEAGAVVTSHKGTDDFDADFEDSSKLFSERSSLRKNFDVDDVSAEYQGRVVSRKQFQAFSDDSADDDDEDDEDGELDLGEDVLGEDDEDEEIEDGEEEEEEEGEDDDEQDEEADEDGEEAEDDDDDASDAAADPENGIASMLVDGLSDQQRRMQEQLAALEDEDEQPTSLFAPRGAAATTVTSSTAASQYTKSVHMKNQLTWHTQLLNMRIRVQGALSAANRLPAVTATSANSEDNEVRDAFAAASTEVRPAYAAALNDARKLLDELFELQTGLMQQNKRIFAPDAAETDDDDDNNTIPRFAGAKRKHAGDDEDEDADTEAISDSESDEILSQYWSYMSSTLTPFFRPVQDALIAKWNTKTQLSAGQLHALAGGVNASRGAPAAAAGGDAGFKVINQSVLAQIDSLMLDETRLVRRAQLHRATGDAAGLLGRVTRERERAVKKARKGAEADADTELDSSLLTGRFAEEYDESIYDDNDYYQQVLAEIISAAGAEAAGDSDLVNKAAAARKKTRKSGLTVDRRASKGRKMRYTVHPKLANFMAPKPAPLASEYANDATSDVNRLTGSGFAMDELFMNLFGGKP